MMTDKVISSSLIYLLESSPIFLITCILFPWLPQWIAINEVSLNNRHLSFQSSGDQKSEIPVTAGLHFLSSLSGRLLLCSIQTLVAQRPLARPVSPVSPLPSHAFPSVSLVQASLCCSHVRMSGIRVCTHPDNTVWSHLEILKSYLEMKTNIVWRAVMS